MILRELPNDVIAETVERGERAVSRIQSRATTIRNKEFHSQSHSQLIAPEIANANDVYSRGSRRDVLCVLPHNRRSSTPASTPAPSLGSTSVSACPASRKYLALFDALLADGFDGLAAKHEAAAVDGAEGERELREARAALVGGAGGGGLFA